MATRRRATGRTCIFFAILAAWMLGGPATARAEVASVPVDVGVGPAVYLISGPVYDDQRMHFGLKLSVTAVLDQAFIQQHQDRVPARYRQMALKMKEVRFSPSILIPDSLFISPRTENTGIYGVTWRPIAINVPLTDGSVMLRLGTGLLLTYFYLYSDVLPDTHFLRPGAELKAEMEIALGPTLLMSLGWSSGFYVPQKLGGFAVGPTSESIWHVGQIYWQLHFRFLRSVTF